MKNLLRTTVILPEDLLQEAKIKAVLEKSSLSDLIRKGLEDQIRSKTDSSFKNQIDSEVIQLSPSQWKEYKDLRLAAVKEDPLAFGLTYDEYLEYPDQYWQDQLEQAENGKNVWIYFLKIEDKLVGMLAANRINKKRMNHLVHIHSMSVQSEFRNKGFASKLLETVLNELTQKPDLLIAQMGVASSQNEAVELYKKFGFEVVGVRKKVFRFETKFFDEILMEKELKSGLGNGL